VSRRSAFKVVIWTKQFIDVHLAGLSDQLEPHLSPHALKLQDPPGDGLAQLGFILTIANRHGYEAPAPALSPRYVPNRRPFWNGIAHLHQLLDNSSPITP
jgi:hypothetical protein